MREILYSYVPYQVKTPQLRELKQLDCGQTYRKGLEVRSDLGLV
jgi:hypothetical protein